MKKGCPRRVVSAVSAGNSIATEMVTETLAKAPVAREGWRASVLMGDFARVEDQADAVVFLASDRARHITGQVISVDGGENLNWVHGTRF